MMRYIELDNLETEKVRALIEDAFALELYYAQDCQVNRYIYLPHDDVCVRILLFGERDGLCTGVRFGCWDKHLETQERVIEKLESLNQTARHGAIKNFWVGDLDADGREARRITIPIDPDRAVQAIGKHFDRDQIVVIIQELTVFLESG